MLGHLGVTDVVYDNKDVRISDLIEEALTSEKEKDNETLARIIVRMRADSKFMSVVKSIYDMNSAQFDSVEQMLQTLQAFGK